MSNGTALLVLYPEEVVPVWGKAQVKCLSGHCSIMGFTLQPHGFWYKMYSPKSVAYVTITSGKEESFVKTKEDIVQLAKDETLESDIIIPFLYSLGDVYLVLLLKHLCVPCLDLVSSIGRYLTLFPGPMERGKLTAGAVRLGDSQLVFLKNDESLTSLNLHEKYEECSNVFIDRIAEGEIMNPSLCTCI